MLRLSARVAYAELQALLLAKSFAEWIEARDDAEATATARKLKKDALKCEVWRGRRLVAVLDAHELAA
jgi:hypothetical protein